MQKRADVIVASGDTATVAAKAATRSIPIVMVVNTDPVERGLVRNLARPEGNVTGVAGSSQGLVAKRIELLRELAPRMRKLGALASTGSEAQALSLKQIQATAAKLGIAVETAHVGKPGTPDDKRVAITASVMRKAADSVLQKKQQTEAALQREAEARQKLAAAEEELEQVLYLQRVARAYQEWRDNAVARAAAPLTEP